MSDKRPSVTRVVKFIRKGDKGENTLKLDLDNENDSILYDGNGNRISTAVTSQGYLYDGLQQLATDVTWSIDTTQTNGVAVQNNGAATSSSYTAATAAWINADGKVTVNGVSADAVIMIRAYYQGQYRYAKLTIKRLVNADKYDLVISPNAVSYNSTTNSVQSGSSISVQVWRTPANGGARTNVTSSLSTYGLVVSVSPTGIYSSGTITVNAATAKNNSNIIVTLTKDGKTEDSETIPINKVANGDEGPEGPQGTNAPYVELSRTSILYQANNDGYSTAAQNFEINCYLKVSGNTCTISSTGNISITSITGVGVTKNSVSKITVKIPHSKIIAGVIIVQMTGTYSGKSYTAKVSITVEPNREGPQGPQGPTGSTGSQGPRGYRGPALRGPQDWAQMDIDYQFYKGDESNQEPYEDFVVYNGNYYKCIKTHTKTASNYPGSSTDTSSHLWQLSDKLAIIAANVLFAKHGYFGSAIISGDWMISTNGTIDGNAYNNGATYQGVIAYSLFNPDNPLGNPIAKHNSTSTVSFAASETTKTINTVSLESGKIYYIEATGRAGSASGAFYVRLRNASTGATHTPIMINGTSNVTRAGYVNITATGSYYLEVYNSGGISGTITESKVMEKNFAPVYALDLLTGKTYQNDAVIKGSIYRPPLIVNDSNYTTYAPKNYAGCYIVDISKTGLNVQLNFEVNSGTLLIDFPSASLYQGAELTVMNCSNVTAYVESVLWGAGDASFPIKQGGGYAVFKSTKYSNNNWIWFPIAEIHDPCYD